LERVVRPIGDWSTKTTSFTCSRPTIDSNAPGVSVGLAEVLAQRRMEHVLDQRRLPRSRNARDADEARAGMSTSTLLRLCSVTPRRPECPRSAQGIATERIRHLHARRAVLVAGAVVVGAAPPRKVFRRERARLLELAG
jgi:hypothetical protein